MRGRAVRAGWLRYAPQAPALAASSVRLRRNVTKPHAERQSRSGRPLRDDSEPVALTIRSPLSFDLVKPSGAPLSDNGK